MLENASPLVRRLVLFWLPIFAIFGGIAYFSQMSFNPEKEAKAGLDRLNTWRRQAGLQTLTTQPELKKAAQKHAQYLTKDPDGHDERNRSNPHFSGSTPQERATAAGYAAPIAENLTIANFARSGRRSVDGLMTALYHRLSLLTPEHDEAGTAWARGKYNAFVVKQGSSHDRELCQNMPPLDGKRYVLTTQCGGKEVKIGVNEPPHQHAEAVKFPIGANIEPSYDGKEQPNPMPNHGKTGNPISIALHGKADDVAMVSFKLFAPDGEIRQTQILTAQNDPNKLLSKTEFALFPIEVLEFDKTYRVEFVYRENGQNHTETWQFKTRKKRYFWEF